MPLEHSETFPCIEGIKTKDPHPSELLCLSETFPCIEGIKTIAYELYQQEQQNIQAEQAAMPQQEVTQ